MYTTIRQNVNDRSFGIQYRFRHLQIGRCSWSCALLKLTDDLGGRAPSSKPPMVVLLGNCRSSEDGDLTLHFALPRLSRHLISYIELQIRTGGALWSSITYQLDRSDFRTHL